MRLRAISLAALTLLSSAPLAAQPAETGTRLEVRAAGYVDDDETYVLRPYVAGRLAAGPVRMGVAYSPDVISTASVDVVATASRAVEETRHQAVADVAYVGEEGLVLGAAYTLGLEPDHESHGAQLSVRRDLDRARLWHGALVLGASWARIGSVVDPRLREEAVTVQATAALTRVLDAATLGRLSLEAGVTEGFQSSPYRTVRLGAWNARPGDPRDPDAPRFVFSGVTGVARERHPGLRVLGRIGLDLVHDVGSGAALLGRLAGYVDDWGIVAGELSGEVRVEPVAGLLLRFGARAYLQSSASFWAQRYPSELSSEAWVTGDRELGPLRSYTILAAIRAPIDEVILDARVEGIRYEHPGFDLLPERHALSVLLGLTWEPDFSL